MPFRVHVEPLQRLGLAQVTGTATGADLVVANEALYGHPHWAPGFDELWDCTRITEFVVHLAEMRAVAMMEIEEQAQIGSGRVVLVITREVVAMMGELYRALVQDVGRAVHVVETLDEGAARLGLATVPAWFTAGPPPGALPWNAGASA